MRRRWKKLPRCEPRYFIDGLYGLGAVHAIRGDLLAAARCGGLAAHLVEKTGCQPRSGVAHEILTQKIGAGLTDEQRALAMSAGASMQLEDVASGDYGGYVPL